MELKTARLTLLIDPNKKAAFEQLCARLDMTPSQVVRQLIREFLKENGVEYMPSGATPPAAPKAARAKPASRKSPTQAVKRKPARRKA